MGFYIPLCINTSTCENSKENLNEVLNTENTLSKFNELTVILLNDVYEYYISFTVLALISFRVNFGADFW